MSRNHRLAGVAGALFLFSFVTAVAIMAKAGQPPFAVVSNTVTSGGLTVTAKVFTSGGWVLPGGSFPLVLSYSAGESGAPASTISVTLHPASVFEQATPPPASGTGVAGSPLVFNLPAQDANAVGKIIVEARGKSLAEDPEVVWKDISADVTVAVSGQSPVAARTHGPKVTTLETARYGDRPFPVVMVQYQDIKHCTGPGTPLPECVGAHTAETLDEKINSQTTGTSLWQLYQDMSFGQLYPIGTVSPPMGSGTVPFAADYVHKFSTLQPTGFCSGVTIAQAHGTPLYANRIENGWYLLPGTQGYYGSDPGGQNIASGATPLAGIDDGCGPIAKIVYDAASLADPDIDYSDYDTDKDGVVDFFNLMFAGCGGHGCLDPTGPNNVWPHKSDIRFYFTDAEGQTGYVSNDQLKDHFGRPMYYTDDSRTLMTTDATALPVFVRVGPYNVNPEDANEHVSVVAHEYGHSLGLPDFYSTTYEAYGGWMLMASDYFQYMDVYGRQSLGWVVPRPLTSGEITLRESKFDTGEIHWTRPDGTPYVLTGSGIHNSDAYRLDLPTAKVAESVPSGTHAWYSGAGDDFGCPPLNGHNLDVYLPDLQQYADASTVTLSFKTLYEMEWDWDYGFVMVSDDGGATWATLPSKNQTTIQGFNPNMVECYATWGNGITGVSGAGPNTEDNPNRSTGLGGLGAVTYPPAQFIDDAFDLTPYKGKNITLRFSYYTDANTTKRGWLIDDLSISADERVIYTSDFEASDEDDRLFPKGWVRASTEDGVPIEHAYFLELRDRINNDFDGKQQSERGSPGWQPGVYMMYTDRAHGYGNTTSADHPSQSPVDANPDPGNDAPDLSDAAFNLSRPTFNGCTHIDNYPAPEIEGGLWKLPPYLKFTVTDITGLSGDGSIPAEPATATIIADVYPDCTLEVVPPQLSIGEGYEGPDTDGAYTLTWTRPDRAAGPDTLEESASCTPGYVDDAEEQLVSGSNSQWSGSAQWTSRPSGGSSAYYIADLVNQDESLTATQPIEIPQGYSSTLRFTTRQGLEAGYDFGYVEASTDGGSSFKTLASYSGPGSLPNDVFVGERVVDLSEFSGQSVLLRFRMTSDAYTVGAPAGWYIDNIAVTNSNWSEVATGDATSHDFAGHPVGGFCYRVRTRYDVAGVKLASPYSNQVDLTVASTIPVVPPVTPPSSGGGAAGTEKRFGGALGWPLMLIGFGAAMWRRRARA